MQRKGYRVPALEERPSLPEHMADVRLCYVDLVREGEIKWSDFTKWADEYGLQDREYVWEVINKARQVVNKWHTSKAQKPAQGTPTSKAPSKSLQGLTLMS